MEEGGGRGSRGRSTPWGARGEATQWGGGLGGWRGEAPQKKNKKEIKYKKKNSIFIYCTSCKIFLQNKIHFYINNYKSKTSIFIS